MVNKEYKIEFLDNHPDGYKIKAKILRHLGWHTYYHVDYWIYGIDANDKSGLTTEEAFKVAVLNSGKSLPDLLNEIK